MRPTTKNLMTALAFLLTFSIALLATHASNSASDSQKGCSSLKAALGLEGESVSHDLETYEAPDHSFHATYSCVKIQESIGNFATHLPSGAILETQDSEHMIFKWSNPEIESLVLAKSALNGQHHILTLTWPASTGTPKLIAERLRQTSF